MPTPDPAPSRSTPPVTPPEQDALWDLLGSVPPPPAPDGFARNTVLQVRLDPSRTRAGGSLPVWWTWFRGFRGLAGAACALLALTALVLRPPAPPTSGTGPDSYPEEHAAILAEELHLMTYVDELLAVPDPALLDDDGLAELLF
jgi:hypothetical protein